MTVSPTSQAHVEDTIRVALAAHGQLSTDVDALAVDDDLYAAGLTSHSIVTIMLACEDAFDVEFETAQLTRATFASIAALTAALAELGVR